MAASAGLIGLSFLAAGLAFLALVARLGHPHHRKLAAGLYAALTHRGKPYDYEFDFSTDNALVCSELIWRAFRDAEGLELAPETIGGRVLLSPNTLAIKFDRELDGGAGQLELALFLDGLGPRRVVEGAAAAFRESWRRPKWHILFT